MLRTPWRAIISATILGLAVTAACGQESEIPREHHAWARFPKGSWKLVRVVSQQFDKQGQTVATSVTETRTTLEQVDDKSFTLLIESTVEIAGRKIVSEPKRVTQQYNGALAGQTAEVKLIGEKTVTIEGKEYPCKVQQYDINGGTTKTLTKTYYSPDVAPFVLRRESRTIDLASGKTIGETLVEVEAVGVSGEVLGKKHSTAIVNVEQKHPKGRESMTAVNSLEVPGGIVSHESRDFDTADKPLGASKLELLEYHVAEPVEQRQTSRFEFRPWRRLAEAQWRPVNCAPARRLIVFRARHSHRSAGCSW